MSTPYFYIIEHKETGKYYAGSRMAVGCHPSDLLVGYSTSSNTIQNLGIENFTVRKIVTRHDAYDYETRFLQRVDARNNDRFYNKHNNEGDHIRPDIRKGMKETPERVAKKMKKVTIDGVEYRSVTEACEKLEVSAHTLKKMIETGHTCDLDRKAKKCVIDGVEYKSHTEAARALGTHRVAIHRYLKTGKRSWGNV
jgi:hypothetical protein